jgi:hypothetical protein
MHSRGVLANDRKETPSRFVIVDSAAFESFDESQDRS